jgi:hypothetical protein
MMKQSKGCSNAETIFGVERIPCDNQIRQLLDPIAPDLQLLALHPCRRLQIRQLLDPIAPDRLFPVFGLIFDELDAEGQLDAFRVFDDNLLFAFDGTQYFSSQKIHCQNCSHKRARNGVTTYFHSAITPVIVAPGNNRVIILEPEFITPQDGHDKQDCEQAAAKRWINTHAERYASQRVTISADDLHCKQTFCELLLEKHFNFVLVCKPDSHKTLYETVDALASSGSLAQVSVHRPHKRFVEVFIYRYANGVPLRAGEDALSVNWCEVTVTKDIDGEVLYHNAFATSHLITDETVAPIVGMGRAHWKIENENNSALKTKGYHLEHNYGHGKEHPSSFLLALNLLAFLFHTVLEMVDDKYQLVREALAARRTFFNDIRALLRYLLFNSWDHLLTFMIRQLELVPDTS